MRVRPLDKIDAFGRAHGIAGDIDYDYGSHGKQSKHETVEKTQISQDFLRTGTSDCIGSWG